ncbi:hypothetical protein DSO57_1009811 [Entomophthora muscae]|uniref:Uncharacterized protein n=1 Tax=Entomophthora muscae TaxID=34485 RepID=A0ACC2RXU5_9FUNG|nr:hypothetical protein DSO57_1009811 [Entomophthora muscae]
MSLRRHGVLYDGTEMPLLGLGTCQAEDKQMYSAVKTALAVGYRHIDCAFIYRNEHEIGQAIAESNVKREHLFVTSKLWNTFHEPHRVEPALDKSLEDLQLKYLDLYLVHWPVAQAYQGDQEEMFETETAEQLQQKKKAPADSCTTLLDTWHAMEKLVGTGKVKHIGVSNFTKKNLNQILDHCKIPPAVNQVELHPYLPQHELLAFCKENRVHVTGYAPLGSLGDPSVLKDPILQQVAENYHTDVANIVLAWGQQRGCTVIPKSCTDSRIKSNFQDVKISPEDMKVIDNLPTRQRFFHSFPIFDD